MLVFLLAPPLLLVGMLAMHGVERGLEGRTAERADLPVTDGA